MKKRNTDFSSFCHNVPILDLLSQRLHFQVSQRPYFIRSQFMKLRQCPFIEGHHNVPILHCYQSVLIFGLNIFYFFPEKRLDRARCYMKSSPDFLIFRLYQNAHLICPHFTGYYNVPMYNFNTTSPCYQVITTPSF